MNRILFLVVPIVAMFGYSIASESDEQIEKAFTHIYDTGGWGTDENGNGFSGLGSTVEEAWPYMEMLVNFLQEKNIKSVVDVGCGDWLFSRHIDWSGIEYIGYDVVEGVIEKNIREFSNSNINFIHGNGASADLPHADLLICKDVLQHLSIDMINKILNQTDKYKYCLFTNDINPYSPLQNRDITSGKGHEIDLTKPPFSLTAKKYFDYQSGRTHKQVFLIVNKKLLFKELYSTSH